MAKPYETKLHHLYHSGGHDTEKEAAERIFPHLNRLQSKVYQYAMSKGRDGFTLIDLSAAMGGENVSTWRTRCNELVKKGLVEDSGTTRKHPGNPNYHTIWRIKPDGPAPATPAKPQLTLF